MSKKAIKLNKLSKIVSEMADDIKIDGLDKAFFEVFEENIEQLTDTRQQSKVKHKLGDIVGIVFFALLADIDEWIEMEFFAIAQREVLGKYLSLENGIPSHDTIERVMSIIFEEGLQSLLVEILKDIIIRATKDMEMPLIKQI